MVCEWNLYSLQPQPFSSKRVVNVCWKWCRLPNNTPTPGLPSSRSDNWLVKRVLKLKPYTLSVNYTLSSSEWEVLCDWYRVTCWTLLHLTVLTLFGGWVTASVFLSVCFWAKQVIFLCEGHINKLVSNAVEHGCSWMSRALQLFSDNPTVHLEGKLNRSHLILSKQCIIHMSIIALYFSWKALWALAVKSFHCCRTVCDIILCPGEWHALPRVILYWRCPWGLFFSRDSNCCLQDG